VKEIKTMAMVNWAVTRIPLETEFLVRGSTARRRLSIAFDDEMRRAGMMLKIKLKARVDAMAIPPNSGE